MDVEMVINHLRFPGQYYDAETGLHYNYFRYYAPGIGRYLRKDPMGLHGGINLFMYATGNPLHFTDKLGLSHDSNNICCDGSLFNCAERCYGEISKMMPSKVRKLLNPIPAAISFGLGVVAYALKAGALTTSFTVGGLFLGAVPAGVTLACVGICFIECHNAKQVKPEPTKTITIQCRHGECDEYKPPEFGPNGELLAISIDPCPIHYLRVSVSMSEAEARNCVCGHFQQGKCDSIEYF